MTPDRWEQINQLYYAALEVAEKERSSFLEQHCSSDPELRSEVRSLLKMHAQVDGFLGKPAIEEVVKAFRFPVGGFGKTDYCAFHNKVTEGTSVFLVVSPLTRRCAPPSPHRRGQRAEQSVTIFCESQ